MTSIDDIVQAMKSKHAESQNAFEKASAVDSESAITGEVGAFVRICERAPFGHAMSASG